MPSMRRQMRIRNRTDENGKPIRCRQLRIGCESAANRLRIGYESAANQVERLLSRLECLHAAAVLVNTTPLRLDYGQAATREGLPLPPHTAVGYAWADGSSLRALRFRLTPKSSWEAAPRPPAASQLKTGREF